MKGGVFRGMLQAMALAFAGNNPWRDRNKQYYPDPICRDRYAGLGGSRKHPRGKSWQGKPRLGRPPCEPGTITYHDKMVRLHGRRKADRIRREWIAENSRIIS